MAFAATVTWEVQSAGSDSNGGGFDAVSGVPGTDYTYPTSTTFAYTDIVIGVTTTQGISVARPFVAADVGNVLNITSGTGFTVQRSQVISVAAGVATFDKSLGTTASIGGTGTLGGCLATPGLASGLMVAGNDLYIKAATYVIASATPNISTGCLSVIGAASAANATKVIGYQATRGDNGTKPLLQAGAISTFSLLAFAGNGIRVENISFDCTLKTAGKCVSGTSSGVLFRCKFANSVGGAVNLGNANGWAVLCEFTGNTTNAASSQTNLLYCTAYTNTVVPFGIRGSYVCIGCAAFNNTGGTTDGFATDASAGGTFIDCMAYNNGRDGFRVTANTAQSQFINCLAVNNAGYGFNASAASDNSYLYNCAGYNNTSGLVNSTVIAVALQIGLITLTADPFANAAGLNFALNNTSGGGAAARAAGIPTATGSFVLPGTTTPSYPDVGASQHQDTGGGGGGGSTTDNYINIRLPV